MTKLEDFITLSLKRYGKERYYDFGSKAETKPIWHKWKRFVQAECYRYGSSNYMASMVDPLNDADYILSLPDEPDALVADIRGFGKILNAKYGVRIDKKNNSVIFFGAGKSYLNVPMENMKAVKTILIPTEQETWNKTHGTPNELTDPIILRFVYYHNSPATEYSVAFYVALEKTEWNKVCTAHNEHPAIRQWILNTAL